MQFRTLSTKQRVLAAIVTALVLVLAYAAGQAWAAERATPAPHALGHTAAGAGEQTPATHPQPIKAPTALIKARRACPNDSSIPACRAALIRQIKATNWQKRARNAARAGTSRDVVLDAIQWASRITGVPAWRLINIGTCESHLFWLAHNGQYLGAWQLGVMHRRDPIFDVVPWQDPYAQALHVARFIKAHGESQWQCSSTGGLRW